MSIPTATALTTGWEPDLADADSLALRWLRHWSDQCAAFAGAAGGTVVRDERYVLTDYGVPGEPGSGREQLQGGRADQANRPRRSPR